LQWVEWPKPAVPSGSFTSVEKLLGNDGKARRIVLRAIEPGEPILEAKLTAPGESPRMAMNLGEGKRAVSIPISAVSGVSGFVVPGDRVDIQLIRQQLDQLTSSIILQDISIIAVDQAQNTETAGARLGQTVTVEVDMVQAQKLSLAQSLGSLSLILRGTEEETSTAPMQPVTADSLNDLMAPEKKVAEDTSIKVRVRRAGQVSTQQFDGSQEQQPGANGQGTGQPQGQSTTGN